MTRRRWTRPVAAAMAVALGFGPVSVGAAEFDKPTLERMFSGQTLVGVYLRGNRDYRIAFHEDGTLESTSGSQGIWWIDDDARYCREYTTGPLTGNRACFQVRSEGNGIAIIFKDKKVATGHFEP